MNEYNPEDYPHPGKALLTELEDLGFSQAGFARYVGVSTEDIVELCSQSCSLSATLACKISRALGTTPRQWLELQLNYDLARVPKDDYEQIKPLGSDT